MPMQQSAASMRSTWGGPASVDDSFEGLFAQLDATAAAGRDADAIRKDRAPRIPKLEHSISYEWRAPPSHDEVLKMVSSDCCRRFNSTTQKSGAIFRKEAILKHPKELTIWHADRVGNAVPDRSIGNPKGRPGLFRYHAQSVPLPEPHDGMLHPQHGTWLKGHYEQRDKHLFPVYHALKNVERAEVKEKEIQGQRETARDVLTRGMPAPEFSSGVQAKLNKAKMALATSRQFNKLQGINVVKEEEKKNKNLVNRAKSVPVLELKPPTPRHRARHLRSWKGPDRRWEWTQTDLCLKHTTPGLQQEEEHALHNSPRYRARGA